MTKKIAVVDCDHIFYLSLTGEKILDENGEPIKVDNKFTYKERTFEESCNVADTYITNILNITNATHYVGFFGGSSFSRKAVYSQYKANRKDLEPLKNMGEMKFYLADKWKFHWLSGCIDETDDYVASFIKQTPDSFIVSPDKDLLNLKTRDYMHYNPKKNEWVDCNLIDAAVYFWKSMICGDTSDGVKGLPGKGEKYFQECIKDIDLELDSNFIGREIFGAYLYYYHFNYDLAIKEFYKNYQCLKIKDDLIIENFKPIEWNYDITK